jgi:hypothetical protein
MFGDRPWTAAEFGYTVPGQPGALLHASATGRDFVYALAHRLRRRPDVIPMGKTNGSTLWRYRGDVPPPADHGPSIRRAGANSYLCRETDCVDHRWYFRPPTPGGVPRWVWVAPDGSTGP